MRGRVTAGAASRRNTAGGKGRGVIFRQGNVIRTVDEPEFMTALIEEGNKILAEIDAGTYKPVSHTDQDFISLDAIPVT